MGIHPQPHLSDADDADTRRSFLVKLAVGGAAVAAGTQIVSLTPLGAQEDGETDVDAEPEAPALTGDQATVAFLAGLSLAAATAYRTATGNESPPAEGEEALPAVTAPELPEPLLEVLRSFGSNHTRQGAALNGHLVTPITAADAAVTTEVRNAIGASGDANAVLAALRSMEERIAATHQAAIGELADSHIAATAIAAMPVVAQQAVVLGRLADVELPALLPEIQSTENAYTPGGSAAPAPETPATEGAETETDAESTESEG